MNLGPGPAGLIRCRVCNFEARSIGEHVQHQRLHASGSNFRYVCPLPVCHFTFSSYLTLAAHVSNHSVSINEVTIAPGAIQRGITCDICGAVEACVKNICLHVVNEHLKNGQPVQCPLQAKCSITRDFKTVSQLRPHLSSYHPGWSKDFGRTDYAVPAFDDPETGSNDFYNTHELSANKDFSVSGSSSSNNLSDDESDVSADNAPGLSDEMVLDYIAKFYAKLEGKLLVPATTVQKICDAVKLLSEVLQSRLTIKLRKNLEKIAGASEDQIESVVHCVLEDDILFNSHHVTDCCESLSTAHRRANYYKKHFQYIEPTEINLKCRDPQDRFSTVQYINIENTLKVMLNDPTVQDQINESFVENNSNPNIVKNYTDGSVFKKRNAPPKRLDLLLYQDSFFGAKNPLGSAHDKYKTLGVYMTLGNLRPHIRSRLRAKRLVMLANERNTKDANLDNGLDKCFKMLCKDLCRLERDGIMYKDEVIPVMVQFILGDHLGQHTIGGFLESFSVEYFCRFCTITRTQFHDDRDQEYPTFQNAKWRTPRHHRRALREKGEEYSFKGIKRPSVFEKLKLNVCDPSLPSCVGHDLFIGGVVDVDLASMIQYFVDKKKWFTYKLLNERIKAFKCKASDSGNKPAKVHLKGKKLGGHAVQNWCLLRLLPVIIGDKIEDKTDNIWQLYLLLKAICEFVCAPALTVTQIATMREMLDNYMMMRKPLKNKYKPKHHYFQHLADLWIRFGPMNAMSTMGFEHYHQFFKRVGRNSNNFVNLLFTFAQKHQLMQAYESTGVLFPSEAVYEEAYPLVLESLPEMTTERYNFSSGALVIKKLTSNEIEYKAQQYLLLRVDNESNIYVACIELIVHDAPGYYFVVSQYRSVFCKEYGIYKIKKRSRQISLLSVENLENPCPHAVYKFQEDDYFSLKHVLLPPVHGVL